MTNAIHETYEENLEGTKIGRKNAIVYVANGTAAKRFELDSEKFLKYLDKIPKGTTIRLTKADPAGLLVRELAARGYETSCCHWHSTGIEKNLPPEEIAEKFASLPEVLFRPLVYRRDLAELRKAVAVRKALIQLRGDAQRRIRAVGRDIGAVKAEDDPELSDSLDAVDELLGKDGLKSPDGVGWDTYVNKKAATVPECVLLAKIAHIKGSLIAAANIIAVIGDVARFNGQVSAVWKYTGNHVVSGCSPKRKKGQPCDWSTKGRTALYQLGQSIIKDRSNPWRAVFDKNREEEMADHRHDGKPALDCKTIDGHCTARAIRKVTKEIIKRFVVAASNQKYVKGHKPKKRVTRFLRLSSHFRHENQKENAARS